MSGIKQQARMDDAVAAEMKANQADPKWVARVNAEWDAYEGRPIQQQVRDDLEAQRADPEWLARVQAEWDAL